MEMKMQSIRFDKEFEARVQSFIDQQLIKESFSMAVIRLTTFALLFFETTKRIDMKVLEEIRALQDECAAAQSRVSELENEVAKARNLSTLKKWVAATRK